MAAIAWTHTFTDGETLTAALLEQMKTDITTAVNGGISSTNVLDGSLVTTDLASPNALYSMDFPLAYYHDWADATATNPPTLAEFQASRVGVSDRISATVDIPFTLPQDSVLITNGIRTYCLTSTGTNNARIRRNGVDIAGSPAFTTNTAVTGTNSATTLLTTDTLLLRITLTAGANDGVGAGIVTLWLTAAHTT